jgi:peptidoglycan hydrolase CwlO-like protein
VALFDDPAGQATGIAVAIALAWKMWLRLRGDTRHDASEESQHAGYDGIITALRIEVTRLSARVDAMSLALDDAVSARREAESENRQLRARVLHLESELDALKRRLEK